MSAIDITQNQHIRHSLRSVAGYDEVVVISGNVYGLHWHESLFSQAWHHNPKQCRMLWRNIRLRQSLCGVYKSGR